MVAHLSNYPKYDRQLEGGQQTLSFQPKKDGEEGAQLVVMSFSVEVARKALAQMICVDELPFRFVEKQALDIILMCCNQNSRSLISYGFCLFKSIIRV